MAKFITQLVQDTHHQWESVFNALDIIIPGEHKHGPCPICGGKDRFRFDDLEGRGTWICNQCGAGDGLDLIAKINRCSLTQAAQIVSTSIKHLAVDKKPDGIEKRVRKILQFCIMDSSPYLKNKGLTQRVKVITDNSIKVGGVCFNKGSMVLELKNSMGNVTGAQLINDKGEKRLLSGSTLKGSFIALNIDKQTSKIIITEGYATALAVASVSDGRVYAAISANNLLNVAKVLRKKYPSASFILAGDNDIQIDGKVNTGKLMAEQAALAVNGLVTIPPTNEKADWCDYCQMYGETLARVAFRDQLYQPQSTPPLKDIISSVSLNTSLPLRKGSDGYDTRQDYTIKGHLPSNSLTSIYGPSGSYKSFLAVSWACHIATGKLWAGKRVTQGAVIYVVGEGGIGVPRRIRAWEKTLNHGSPIDALYRIDCPVFPASSESVKQVILAAKQVEWEIGMPVRLIVLDTLARCFGGSDENAAKDMGAFIQGCDLIKSETLATVLIVHHSGKDIDKGARGSSAFRAALDVEFNVRREGEGGALILSCTKMKDAEEPPRLAYDLVPVDIYTDDDGEQVASLVLLDQPRESNENELDPELAGVQRLTDNHIALWQSVRSRIAKGEHCTKSLVRDDMRAMGFDVSKKFSRWLDKLEKDGLVKVDGENIIPIIDIHNGN